MTVGTIRPIALSRLSQEVLSVMISRRCHSALYGCLVHDFLPEVSHGSLARVQVPARHSRCGASKALRARGSPPSHSILLDLNSSQMVQGIQRGPPRHRPFGLATRGLHPITKMSQDCRGIVLEAIGQTQWDTVRRQCLG